MLVAGASEAEAEAAARRSLTLQPRDAFAYVALGALVHAPEGVRLLQAPHAAPSHAAPSHAAPSHAAASRPLVRATFYAVVRDHPVPSRPTGGLSAVAIGRSGHAPACGSDHVPRSGASPRACAARCRRPLCVSCLGSRGAGQGGPARRAWAWDRQRRHARGLPHAQRDAAELGRGAARCLQRRD